VTTSDEAFVLLVMRHYNKIPTKRQEEGRTAARKTGECNQFSFG